MLNGCRRAHGAGYQHGNRTGCLKGTREGVLSEIESWTEDFEKAPIFWLNGLAGTGKSTIAQTVAERTFADGRLGASFFCSRGFEDRSNLQLIFPTLALQLAHRYPDFRSSLVPLLQSNPDVVHESLRDQMEKFIVEPLRSADISTVIVIDALDECRDEDPESAVLLVLGRSVSEIPRVKFFITSRPETHIMSGFRGPLLKGETNVFILHEVEPRTVDDDIRRLFKHELSVLARQRSCVEGWPADDQLDSLCRRAAGFFVYAVATVNFLKHKFQRPSDRLDIITKSPESTTQEGRAELKVYNSLDSLYASIFHTAFLGNNADDDAVVRSVLSVVVLVANPLSPSAIATLMGFEVDVVLPLLQSIQSLLALRDNADHPIQPFHKSFPDFITDPTRCINARFYITPDHHIELLLRCLELMGNLLEKNMCSLPDHVLNSDVSDLSKRAKEGGIHGALEYACRSWHKHLIPTKHRIADVVSALSCFLEGKFTFWLEVLSVLGTMGDAAHGMSVTIKWLDEVFLDGDLTSRAPNCEPTAVNTVLSTAADCLHFVTEFFEVISQSAPHVYHSALQLAPRSSVVWKLYSQQVCSPTARIVTGIPDSWDSCTASTGVNTNNCHAAWSPCGKFIAATSVGSVEIRDSNTLERLSVLRLHEDGGAIGSLIFSPDGCLLACFSYHG